MSIVNVRRISQAFFLLLFVWFCIVSTFGSKWWQLRGWPVNWFLQLDPLVAVGTILTTRTLYAGLLWALVPIALTVLFGRFFCGWACPFGTVHHVVGFLGKRGKNLSQRATANAYDRRQAVKYYLLMFLLAAAAGALLARAVHSIFEASPLLWLMALASLAVAGYAAVLVTRSKKKAAGTLLLLIGGWALLAFFFSIDSMVGASLQTGLLDPIPLMYRSVNLILVPLADAAPKVLSVSQRHYEGTWLIGLIFLTTIMLNLRTPRFYCRYICPLGAFYGVLSRFALWRIGKKRDECTHCDMCEANCEGACSPTHEIRIPECVLCVNCLHDCRHDLMGYQTRSSASGEALSPDLSRRGVVVMLLSGIAAVPIVRLSGYTEQNWNPGLIRPPGALPEADLLARCIKCGQCMRVCPTGIIQPAELGGGVEGLWTPRLNFRIGTSGCQQNCIACSHVCPTAAIRPISLDEKLGRGDFADRGPVRLGTAFVDHGRCLPWAMDKPCIVCQENCPVSPKAIFVKEIFSTLREGILKVNKSTAEGLEIAEPPLVPGKLSTGDHFISLSTGNGNEERWLIMDNTDRALIVSPQKPFPAPLPKGALFALQVRLQRPQVDPARCTGCGVCEHECPVTGKRAIRVTAENESRNRKRSLLL